MPFNNRRNNSRKKAFLIVLIAGILLFVLITIGYFYFRGDKAQRRFRYAHTVAGLNREFGEPFGIAVLNGVIYVSDGDEGTIKKISPDGTVSVYATGFDTPSDIAFDNSGNLIVADSGSNSIKSVDSSGAVKTIAGKDGVSGSQDGEVALATFNAPIGIAITENGRIYVADTYNDSIRLIENSKVSTIVKGLSSPNGIAVYGDSLLIADTGNHRICILNNDGSLQTLAEGEGSDASVEFLGSAGLSNPKDIAVSPSGEIFIADGNSIKAIGDRTLPFAQTLVKGRRGYLDGPMKAARFNRISGIAFGPNGELLVTDSDNKTVRSLSTEDKGKTATHDEIAKLRYSPEEFRKLQPPRWPFDPPLSRRDIAATLGEVRGDVIIGKKGGLWFHNGLDIAGAYGETAKFIRTEKVLDPAAAQNFGTLRELLRMPTVGYIHLRLGRNANGQIFGDPRFQFTRGLDGKLNGVRVPRGTRFEAGDAVGTLNAMNHIHFITGRSGAEMNSLAALDLPGVADSISPTIESVSFFDKNWKEIETETDGSRIRLKVPVRVIVRAFDRMDGNPERRKLGVYRVGYKLLSSDGSKRIAEHTAFTMLSLPDSDDVRMIYAPKSHSGATGVTIFNYIATNTVPSLLEGVDASEGFIDPTSLENGTYILQVLAEDYFGNKTEKEITIEVKK